MQTRDNQGKLVSEINHSRTADGRSVTTTTLYNTHNGQASNQNITVRDSSGKVTTTNILNGKVLP